MITVHPRRLRSLLQVFPGFAGVARAPSPVSGRVGLSVCLTREGLGKAGETVRATGPGPHYEVQGEGCTAAVLVSVGAKALHPLSDGTCSLLKLVRLLLPPTAKATRAFVGACRSPTVQRTSAGPLASRSNLDR